MSDLQTVSAEELAILEPLGERRTVEVDDVLYRAGDPIYDFYVVISGQVEITVEGGDLVATHGPGRFLGELNMLTGSRVFVTARVSERGEVLTVPATSLRLVLATEPELSDKILATFMERRATPLTAIIRVRLSPGNEFVDLMGALASVGLGGGIDWAFCTVTGSVTVAPNRACPVAGLPAFGTRRNGSSCD